MASKVGTRVAFNKYLKELIGKVSVLFPQNEKIRTAKNLFHAGLIADENLYLENFHTEAVVQFKDAILERRESVFIQADFSFFPDAEEFKGLWLGLSQQNKKCVWDYLKILVTLADRYYK